MRIKPLAHLGAASSELMPAQLPVQINDLCAEQRSFGAVLRAVGTQYLWIPKPKARTRAQELTHTMSQTMIVPHWTRWQGQGG